MVHCSRLSRITKTAPQLWLQLTCNSNFHLEKGNHPTRIYGSINKCVQSSSVMKRLYNVAYNIACSLSISITYHWADCNLGLHQLVSTTRKSSMLSCLKSRGNIAAEYTRECTDYIRKNAFFWVLRAALLRSVYLSGYTVLCFFCLGSMPSLLAILYLPLFGYSFKKSISAAAWGKRK